MTPLRIGNYSVAVEAPGFKTETHSGIVLQVQDRVRVDFTMQVGAVSDTVSVQESTPVIQTETSALGDVVASQQITDMPLNGRDYTQLATLTTGVIKITENGGGINGATSATNGNAGGAFAVNGTRGNLNNFMLDGIDNNSNDNAGNILSTNVDAIQEFKVQTSGYSAEFGRSGGAVINATIKSGTNGFHGTAFEFLRNSALDARGFFEPAGSAQGAFPPEPVRRYGGRSHQAKQDVFLRGLSGNAHRNFEDRHFHGSNPGRDRRQFQRTLERLSFRPDLRSGRPPPWSTARRFARLFLETSFPRRELDPISPPWRSYIRRRTCPERWPIITS